MAAVVEVALLAAEVVAVVDAEPVLVCWADDELELPPQAARASALRPPANMRVRRDRIGATVA